MKVKRYNEKRRGEGRVNTWNIENDIENIYALYVARRLSQCSPLFSLYFTAESL